MWNGKKGLKDFRPFGSRIRYLQSIDKKSYRGYTLSLFIIPRFYRHLYSLIERPLHRGHAAAG